MSDRFDVIIADSNILDGTGKPAFKGSIGIKGERIVAVGNVTGDAAEKIQAAGLIACPGFVDIHTHIDLNLLQYPLAENFVMQGITTCVGGNCGLSMAPIGGFMPWGVFTSSMVGSWWHEVEPHSYGPPKLLPLARYREVLEDKLGFSLDWRTFGEFLSKVDQGGISINYVPLVGHNSVRLAVMGEDFQRRAKPSEIERMKEHVAEAMGSGAFGLGAGFDGGPGDFAPTEEVIELAKVAQKQGGIYASHTRNFDNNYPSTDPQEWGYGICHHISPEEMPVARYYGYLEALQVARKAKISTQIAHICPGYTIYQHYPEILQEAAARATLDIIDKARGEGLDVSFDLIPDHDMHGIMLSQPSLIGLFSNWLTKLGSRKRLVENLKIREFREALKKEIMGGRFKFIMIHPKTDSYWMDRLVILVCGNRAYRGQTIGEIARTKGTDPFETLFDMVVDEPRAKISCFDPRCTETTVRVLIQHPSAMVGSDLVIVPFENTDLQGGGGLSAGEPGLATYGLFPRYIRTFVRERPILTLEEAVRKATYLPAQKLGLKDRGVIKPGAYADILLFDFEKIRDKGTWFRPRVRPEGVVQVMVNGQVVYGNMAHTGARPGKVLRHR